MKVIFFSEGHSSNIGSSGHWHFIRNYGDHYDLLGGYAHHWLSARTVLCSADKTAFLHRNVLLVIRNVNVLLEYKHYGKFGFIFQ